MQMPPGDFLRKLRLEKATRLLQTDTIGLAEVAARSGFQSASYFCRAFRQSFNMSPGEFRESGGEAE
jgi:two-component system response regulator YesN